MNEFRSASQRVINYSSLLLSEYTAPGGRMTSFGNVFFLGVARIANQGVIVASYSYNTETDLGAVRQMLEQPNLSMAPGKHYSFSVGQLAWHLIAGNSLHEDSKNKNDSTSSLTLFTNRSTQTIWVSSTF